MNKKEFLIPIVFIGLSIAFLVISGIVFLTDGKSKKWIARKMKIGALLLTLSAVAETGCITHTKCYVQMPSNLISIEKTDHDTLNIRLSEGNTIKGNISNVAKGSFSYMITDSTYTNIIVQENMIAEDGAFDAFDEKFSILIPPMLKVGNYYLFIFDLQKEKQKKKLQ